VGVVPPWLRIAESYIGLKEIKGTAHNPTIWGWLRKHATNVKRKWIERKGDEIPWCAVFVSHCLEAAGMQSTASAQAVSYATYGKPSKFIPGAVIVIKRKKTGSDKTTGSRAGFHVGFLSRVTKTHVLLIGGNQGNRVSRKWFPKRHYDIKACRWPLAT
jgi:uncharacterized protein (TIGR02594 family)